MNIREKEAISRGAARCVLAERDKKVARVLQQNIDALGVGDLEGALQKYADYVGEHKDFPLTEFRARHSQATEAVGYGKSLMLWHMLRRRLGDETFAEGLRRLISAMSSSVSF